MGARARRKFAVLIVALMALCWQGFVLGTHVHPAGATADRAVAVQAADGRSAQHKKATDQSNDCPVCREILLSGAYTLPPPFAFIAQPLTAWLIPVGVPVLRLAHEYRAHGWQSRAPPHAPR